MIEADGLIKMQHVDWFTTYRVHHRVADRFRVGRAFLLGDAGHIHSPIGGQGMNTGLGDAANLAWKLAQALHNGSDAVLETYESERQPFARALVRTVDRAFQELVNPSLPARITRALLAALLPALLSVRAARRMLFNTTSQTRLGYPNSALSAGKAGKLRGGARLPWVPLEHGSNYDALMSLTWQLHVYGNPDPGLAGWCAEHNVPLHVFPFNSAAARRGLQPGAAYLVRPDGYIGLAASHVDHDVLTRYAERWLPTAVALAVPNEMMPARAH